ncbi:response regulator [Argonema antarcticum]|uniref:response regulator n=1 Tax=Argonema antarcticum TaxID=2942763 RepID=UPI002012EDC9|nr:response regulator [Argonema antarcticum]MCL1474724.1 response regulator [Argonema antarcticum A004/B2]
MTNDKLTNLLLVDDDDVDVMIVQRAFDKNNITDRLYVAANGVEALFMLRDGGKPPLIPRTRRLILLDLNMPKMGGIEFLRELRSDPQLRTIPVIVLTTSNEEKDKLEAYNLNVAGYILKPVTFTKFVEVMATINNYWNLNEMP